MAENFYTLLKKEIVAKACATKSKKDLDKVFESLKLLRR